jgi:hypothetical protein
MPKKIDNQGYNNCPPVPDEDTKVLENIRKECTEKSSCNWKDINPWLFLG